MEREAAAYDEAAVVANKQARLDAEKSRNMVGSGVMHEKSPAHSGCPGSMARSIFRRPAAASGEAVQASSYEQAAVECVQNTTDKTVNQQADVIYAAKGKISISELAEQMGCTVRHVHRRFVEELGVSPKRFARIVRIRETVRKMLEHPGGHVTDYMDDMGYSDQAHFQREFKWYTGMTPGSLLKILGDRAER